MQSCDVNCDILDDIASLLNCHFKHASLLISAIYFGVNSMVFDINLLHVLNINFKDSRSEDELVRLASF